MNQMYYDDVLLWKYIDQWPLIPKQLVNDALGRVSDQKLQFANVPGQRAVKRGDEILYNMQYCRWDIPVQLVNWIQDCIYTFDTTGIQFFINRDGRERIFPHCDSVQRRWVAMYVCETGGEEVKTFFYKQYNQNTERSHRVMVDDLDTLETIGSVVIEPNRWILMNGLVLHDVYPITSVRKTIVCGVEQEDNSFAFV